MNSLKVLLLAGFAVCVFAGPHAARPYGAAAIKKMCLQGKSQLNPKRCMSFARLLSVFNATSGSITRAALNVGDANCAYDESECGCSWIEDAVCVKEIAECAAECVASWGTACFTCLGEILGCADCVCYYVCGYDGPGDLAYELCPSQYTNCTDSK